MVQAVDIEIVQSVPIKVLPVSEAAQFQEPNVPAPQVVMEMPPLRALRSVVDRLKAVHKTVTVEASRAGTLALRIDSYALTLQTLFAHLRFRDDLVDDEEEEDDDDQGDSQAVARGNKRRRREDSSSVTVDAKVLGKAILMDCSSADSVLCCKASRSGDADGFLEVLIADARYSRTAWRRHLGEPRAGAARDPRGRLRLTDVLPASADAGRVSERRSEAERDDPSLVTIIVILPMPFGLASVYARRWAKRAACGGDGRATDCLKTLLLAVDERLGRLGAPASGAPSGDEHDAGPRNGDEADADDCNRGVHGRRDGCHHVS
jgi:hypothetical protein